MNKPVALLLKESTRYKVTCVKCSYTFDSTKEPWLVGRCCRCWLSDAVPLWRTWFQARYLDAERLHRAGKKPKLPKIRDTVVKACYRCADRDIRSDVIAGLREAKPFPCNKVFWQMWSTTIEMAVREAIDRRRRPRVSAEQLRLELFVPEEKKPKQKRRRKKK